MERHGGSTGHPSDAHLQCTTVTLAQWQIALRYLVWNIWLDSRAALIKYAPGLAYQFPDGVRAPTALQTETFKAITNQTK